MTDDDPLERERLPHEFAEPDPEAARDADPDERPRGVDHHAERFERVIDTARRAEPAAQIRPPDPVDSTVVDAWSFVGPYRSRQPGTPYEMEDLLEEHTRFGITSRLCLHAEARDGVPDEGNFALGRMAVVAPGTGLIWTVLPPARFNGTPTKKLLADADTAGVGMFALFPKTHAHPSAPWANRELYAAMEDARLPLALDVEQTGYDEVHAIATAHRKLPILLWGAWYVDERLLIPLLDQCSNVRIGLAGDRRVFNPTWGIEQFTGRYGPGRLIYGSGWPRQSPGPALSYVRYAAIRPHLQDAILGDAVRELLTAVRWRVAAFPKPAKPETPERPGKREKSGKPEQPETSETPA